VVQSVALKTKHIMENHLLNLLPHATPVLFEFV